ncbi:MAG: hypothetical protein ACXWC8_14575, partial [Limisphaerales bacterium]
TKARLYINQALRDGTTYEPILQQLAADGHAHITYDNLATWCKTGYIDWLRDQEKFEQLVLAMDKTQSQKTPATKKKKFRALSELDFAIQLHTAARQFNLEKFSEHLETKPENFLRLVQTNAMHERNAILRDRHELELKKVAAKKPKRVTTPKRGGVTPEELERLTRRMNL